MSLFARLQEDAAPIRERILAHPFVRGLGDGTLPGDQYQYYLRQDYLFLIEYCRVLALAAARADEVAIAGRFSDLLNQTLNVEMDLHRETCWACGISPETLEDTRPSATTLGYTNHLRLVAETKALVSIVTAILPCAHGYWEIASALRARGLPRVPAYENWIKAYTADEYAAAAHWLAGLLDRLGEEISIHDEAALREIFLTSVRYEYLFWETAQRMEEWPV
ncbi:MAG TPA: thiaminase II [bacterium]|nr:thiaminase II [bacterium]